MSISRKASHHDDDPRAAGDPDRLTDETADERQGLDTDRLGADHPEDIHRARENADRRASRNLPTPDQMADPGDLADPNQPSPHTPPAR